MSRLVALFVLFTMAAAYAVTINWWLVIVPVIAAKFLGDDIVRGKAWAESRQR